MYLLAVGDAIDYWRNKIVGVEIDTSDFSSDLYPNKKHVDASGCVEFTKLPPISNVE